MRNNILNKFFPEDLETQFSPLDNVIRDSKYANLKFRVKIFAVVFVRNTNKPNYFLPF